MQRLRRTMMFVPGNNPAMMQDAFIYGPDSIMLDLEDSVTMTEKDAARLLVYNALRTIDYGDTEMVVRINPLNTPYGKKDIEAVVKAGVDVKGGTGDWMPGPHEDHGCHRECPGYRECL